MSEETLEQKNEQALTPKESIAVPATAVQRGRGHEEPSSLDELEIPRAKLIQFTSEEAQAKDKDERREPGSVINSMTGEVLGDIFIPIFKFTTFVQWNPRKKDDPNFDPAFEPGAMVFSSTDRRDPRVIDGINFGPNGEAPKVTKYLNFFCHFLGHDYPLVLSFSKTSFAAGKRLNSLTQFPGINQDMFLQKFKLKVKQQEAAGTSYFVFNVTTAGKVTEEEYRIAEKLYNTFRGKNITVHSEEPAESTKSEPAGWAE